MPTPRVFTPQMTTRLLEMAARGFAGPAIATALSAMQAADKTPLTAESIRKKCCALGIALRPVRPPKQCRVEIGHDTRAILARAAKVRGVSVSRLARQILATVAVDGLVNAVLDTPAMPKVRHRERRNGVPVNGRHHEADEKSYVFGEKKHAKRESLKQAVNLA